MAFFPAWFSARITYSANPLSSFPVVTTFQQNWHASPCPSAVNGPFFFQFFSKLILLSFLLTTFSLSYLVVLRSFCPPPTSFRHRDEPGHPGRHVHSHRANRGLFSRFLHFSLLPPRSTEFHPFLQLDRPRMFLLPPGARTQIT